jgi:hypothetical protein
MYNATVDDLIRSDRLGDVGGDIVFDMLADKVS